MDVRSVSTTVSVESERRFRLLQMVAHEALSTPYLYELDVSGSAGLDIERMLGLSVAVRIELQGPIGRYFHGRVEQVTALPPSGKTGNYRLLLRPALAALTRCSRRRVFQDLSAVQVVAAVLDEHAIDHEFLLHEEHRPRPLIIQYDETDLDFVARLLEHEGIFYYFRHQHDGETLMLRDSADGIAPFPGYQSHALLRTDQAGEGILALDPLVRAAVARVELDDVDPAQPGLDLAVGHGTVRRDDPCTTLFEYPGGYSEIADGRDLARRRLDAHRAGAHSASGTAASRGVVVGHRFMLQGHRRDALNGPQVVVRTISRIDGGPVTATARSVSATMQCSLTTSPLGAALPLPKAARRQDLRGPHTATVVGPAGETIDVDAQGRVLVRFPWQDDDGTAVRARVGQLWAGQGRGALVIPRIGDEVLVEFEHGDAARPVVVGALFNGAAQPPVILPDEQSQTVFRTRSADSGATSELRIDDRDDAQLLALHAARDYELRVDKDARLQVGDDCVQAIGGDQTTSVGGGLILGVGSDEQVTVAGKCTHTIGKGYALHADKTIAISGADTLTIQAQKKISIAGPRDIRIANDKASVELKANGDVLITGARVFIKATGLVQIKGANIVEQEDV